MTGIERHWQEECEKELQAKRERLEALRKQIAPYLQAMQALECELYPERLYVQGQMQQNQGMGQFFGFGGAFGAIGGGLA